MNELRLLLAFDHELSLGGSESYPRDLFDPTDELLDAADALEAPITLFTDVCCAIRFRQWDPEGFFRPYCRQIESVLERGHDVQLHLHPHWMDSEFRHGRFIPAGSYSLGEFCDRPWPNNVPGIVGQGVELLEELCRPKRPGYRCIAYRAGGFSLSPATAAVLSALYQHGIRIESSIAKGNYLASDLWRVDHRRMPDKANWYIALPGPLDREASGGLYEIPIASRPRTPINNLPFLMKRLVCRFRRHRPAGWMIDAGRTSLGDKLKRLAPRSAWLLGFDSFTDSADDLMKILRHHVAVHPGSDLIACSTVSHPKNMGLYARRLMRAFVERVRADYGDAVRLCTYRQFYDEFLAARREAGGEARVPR